MAPRGRPAHSNGTTPSDASMPEHDKKVNGPQNGVVEDSIMVRYGLSSTIDGFHSTRSPKHVKSAEDLLSLTISS